MSSPTALAYTQPRGSISDDNTRKNGDVPTLETPEGTWSPGAGDVNGARQWDDPASDVRRGSYDDGSQRGQPLMRLQNRSTPALPTHMDSQGYDARPPPFSGQPQDPMAQLNFGAMSIQDPIPRSGTSNSYRPGEGPRRGQGLPAHPYPRHGPPPPHQQQWGPPPPGPNGGAFYDGGSVYSGRSSHFDGSSHGHDTDASSIRSGNSRRGPMGPPPNGYMQRPPPPGGYPGYPPPQGYPGPGGPGWHPPPPQQYQQEFNPLYAAATDVLGLGPPPGQGPFPGPGPSQAPIPHSASAPPYAGGGPGFGQGPPPPGPPGPGFGQGPPPPGPPGSGFGQGPPPPGPPGPPGPGLSPYSAGGNLTRGPSSASSIRAPERRPGFDRAPETLSTLNTRKSKAIDVRDPPYTKEYVEDYRTRIKADPDPEAHFAYAKYLIDAAKRIGSDTPDDRQVRKYREGLITESLKVIRRLATQGETYAEAQFFLANCHGTGMLGLQVDHERAYHLYLQAAKQNHPAACYRVGVCNDIGAGTKKDPLRAFTFYRKAASLGDTAAMYKLGTILLRGVPGQQQPNAREAVQWLKRAAEQADDENPHALYTLATLHERPDNEGMVIHDIPYAIELYTRAGQLGHVPSQLKLGVCYEQGLLGCPVEPRKSIAWYSKAAEKGDPEAELSLSGWYLTGAEGILKQSDSEAYLWARKAANKAWPRAEYAVGYYAETGIGVQQDMELAKRWYMRAAAQGNKRAMARLTELKRLGNRRVAAARPTRQQAGDENCVIM
ncbi:hypothetical protein FRC04_000986 [Tulasnella sp. 424]|nr:hypothetical protein FRC04_000986 [Tulasnella sp. 424]KAG8977897.1 hypothetical protein FRC05_000425 [Tulasnella sp. 425]